MLKHKKQIIIRNEHLRKIRNSLREFWIRIIYDEIEILRNFASLYDDWSNITLKEENEFSQLQARKINLFHLISKSICSCPLCTNTDRDMVYIPDHETWYCIECQEKGFIWDSSHGSEEDILNQDYINRHFEHKDKLASKNNNREKQ
ncbi:MAG: hypothetical protein ACFFAG_19150 [Promethearchaeota archaeon]